MSCYQYRITIATVEGYIAIPFLLFIVSLRLVKKGTNKWQSNVAYFYIVQKLKYFLTEIINSVTMFIILLVFQK